MSGKAIALLILLIALVIGALALYTRDDATNVEGEPETIIEQ